MFLVATLNKYLAAGFYLILVGEWKFIRVDKAFLTFSKYPEFGIKWSSILSLCEKCFISSNF